VGRKWVAGRQWSGVVDSWPRYCEPVPNRRVYWSRTRKSVLRHRARRYGKVFPKDYAQKPQLHRANEVVDRLNGLPPASWYITAFVALLIVWAEVGMAILLAFFTPTIGLGCWSGSFVIYGILSTLSWLFQLINTKNKVVRWICHVTNVLSFGWLVVVTFLMVSRLLPLRLP
jgi:hypothetical protein